MKNLKIFKSALAILSLSSIALFSGCSSNNVEAQESTNNQANTCGHLTIYFEDQPITFKECEGYEMELRRESGVLKYSITKENQEILTCGHTNQYNYYEVYHDIADEIINNESLQKVK